MLAGVTVMQAFVGSYFAGIPQVAFLFLQEGRRRGDQYLASGLPLITVATLQTPRELGLRIIHAQRRRVAIALQTNRSDFAESRKYAKRHYECEPNSISDIHANLRDGSLLVCVPRTSGLLAQFCVQTA